MSYSLDVSVRFGCTKVPVNYHHKMVKSPEIIIDHNRRNLLWTAESNGGSLQSLSSSYSMQSGLVSVSYSPRRTKCLKYKYFIVMHLNKNQTENHTMIHTIRPDPVYFGRLHNVRLLQRFDHLCPIININCYFTFWMCMFSFVSCETCSTYIWSTACPRFQLFSLVAISKQCRPWIIINWRHITTNNLNLKMIWHYDMNQSGVIIKSLTRSANNWTPHFEFGVWGPTKKKRNNCIS